MVNCFQVNTMKSYPPEINDPSKSAEERLDALQRCQTHIRKRLVLDTAPPDANGEINNHIHTIYSFSPYTPAMAALLAKEAGLAAAGSVDHDSIAAAREMLAAAAILGIGGCVGFELRVSFKNGPFALRKINNPDSEGLAYMTVQGVPVPFIPDAAEFLEPIRERRLLRTEAMTVSANAILREANLEEIDFQIDVCGKSKYAEGGGITERHLLAAFAEKLILKHGKGRDLTEALKLKMGVSLKPNLAALLLDAGSPHYLYDLLGVLKSEILPRIFIQPDDKECIPVKTATDFAGLAGAIPAYAYLGDVGASPTGDKKAEKFEDDFLEELFAELSRLGFKAVAYMPPRNTPEQLRKVRRLCVEWRFMEISGVDINSTRQSFNCPEVLREENRHLIDTTWALIAHERLSSVDARYGLFSENNPLYGADLPKLIGHYAELGKKLDLHHPEESALECLKSLK
jgi:hypothetical protein